MACSKLVLEKVVSNSEGNISSYQGAELKCYTLATLENCKKQALGDLH